MNTIKKALQSSQRDFGIVIKPTLVIVQIFVKELQDDTQNVYLQPGTLLKIIPNIQQDFVDDDDDKQLKKSNNNKNTNENSSYVIIQVLDYYDNNPIWENVYKCNKNDIKPIGQNIWPYVIAITDPDDRILFLSNTDRIHNCLYMNIGDLVTAWFIEIIFECEILYIGLVPELGPGYYFGLRLLNFDKGYSPQTDKICKFAKNYTKCDANQTLILSAISIFKNTNKDLKKKTSSAKDLFCGTINRAKNVLGISTIPNNLPPPGVITRNSSLKRNPPIKRHSSLNRQSTNSRKLISPNILPYNKITKKNTVNDLNVGGDDNGNQFSILNIEETEDNTISIQNNVMENHNNKSNNNNQKLTGQTVVVGGANIPPSTSSSASSIGSTSSYKRSNKSTNTNFPHTNNETTIINQTTSQQHQQQNLNYNSNNKENSSTIKSRDKSIQIDDNLIQLENEEYARKIENYEKYIEQKNISSNTINSGGSLPVSILKQPKIGQITTNNNSNSSNSSSSTTITTGTNNNNSFTINYKKKNNNLNSIVKPNTIMSLEDRDIVVIDKADIKESTKNENSIIVLDNPRKEVDLADLLGKNWPVTAGDAAQVLNTTTTITDQMMTKNISSGNNAGNGVAHIHSSSSNSSSVSNYSVNKNERNKSGNPLSHMVRNTSDRRNKENLSKLHQQQHNETGNLDNKPGERKLKNTEPLYDNTNNISLLQHQKHVLSSEASSSSIDDDQIILPSPLNEIPEIPGLGVGSMVEVSTDVCEDLYGVIRWIGFPNSSKNLMVGVELEDDPGEIPLNLTDGALNGKRLFKCPERRAFFIYPNQCSIDRRFLEIEQPISESSNGGATGINTNNTNAPVRASSSNTKNIKSSNDTKMFGQVECPPVPGAVAPLKMMTVQELEEICGKFKGIQGHHNSCYLDATLFSMFTFTSVFDSLLFRPPEREDISHYEEVQKVLREEIVNPLRKNVFVRADRVMKLRQLLEKLSSVSGLTCEEKDPEEFLNSLLAQILRADPFLKLSSGQDTFFYQLFVEKDERLSFPSVQQLFEQSFLASDIKLKEVPSCLIIQMPRFGKNFKMYPRILPSQVLDVTDIIEDSPRQCTVCGKLAEFECRECFGIMQCGVGLESTSFCKKCLETAHSHTKRAKHNPKEISVPEDFKIMAEHLPVPPRLFMELFAVVCIETSHYVSFVKAGAGQDAPWCFFDSMADRKGEQNGYNIPELLTVPDLPQWLSEDGARNIHEAASNDKMLPEHAKRLLCDAYMCMYQSTDVMMYR